MGILTMLFIRQILKYLGTDALPVYGIIINISTFVQCCAYSIGQAAQPLIFLLPAVAGANAVWFAMPVTELIVAIAVAVKMIQYTKKLSMGTTN